jgi:biopolymer transport protein ExbD
MRRQHKRGGKASLNMVSLMDIFTILVFFLLVNSSSVQQQTGKGVELPQARAEQLPRETMVIMVSAESIVVQGRLVSVVDDRLLNEEGFIPSLKEELEHQYNRQRMGEVEGEGEDREVTVMADKAVPYKLIKRIMLTASDSRYGNVSLAVMKREKKKSGG